MSFSSLSWGDFEEDSHSTAESKPIQQLSKPRPGRVDELNKVMVTARAMLAPESGTEGAVQLPASSESRLKELIDFASNHLSRSSSNRLSGGFHRNSGVSLSSISMSEILDDTPIPSSSDKIFVWDHTTSGQTPKPSPRRKFVPDFTRLLRGRRMRRPVSRSSSIESSQRFDAAVPFSWEEVPGKPKVEYSKAVDTATLSRRSSESPKSILEGILSSGSSNKSLEPSRLQEDTKKKHSLVKRIRQRLLGGKKNSQKVLDYSFSINSEQLSIDIGSFEEDQVKVVNQSDDTRRHSSAGEYESPACLKEFDSNVPVLMKSRSVNDFSERNKPDTVVWSARSPIFGMQDELNDSFRRDQLVTVEEAVRKNNPNMVDSCKTNNGVVCGCALSLNCTSSGPRKSLTIGKSLKKVATKGMKSLLRSSSACHRN